MDDMIGAYGATIADIEEFARREAPEDLFKALLVGEPPLRANIANTNAFSKLQLRPRVLMGADPIGTETTILDSSINLPVMIAPTGLQRRWHLGAESAAARAAAAAGTIFVLATASDDTIEEVAAASSGPLWFQLCVFGNKRLTQDLVERAESAGYRSIVVLVDNVTYEGYKARDLHPNLDEDYVLSNVIDYDDPDLPTAMTIESYLDKGLSWKDIEWIRSLTSLPLVIKGIQTAEDAQLCVEHGVDGLIVSNHGGHALNDGYGTVDILPSVTDVVQGQVEVYIDGGIRSGTDVLKAMALGARGVFIGRAAIWGLISGGEHGVSEVLRILKRELISVMGLCGISNVTEISRALVEVPHE